MAAQGESSIRIDFTTFHNIIDGKVSSALMETRSLVDPSTLENNPKVPLSTIEDVDRAVKAAQRAAKSWAEVPWGERANAVKSLADAIETQAEDFVKMLMKETGKPVSIIRVYGLFLDEQGYQFPGMS